MTELTIGSIGILPKKEGRPLSRLDILRRHRIGSGTFGTAFKAEVVSGTHARNFVVKRFKQLERQGLITTAKENAAKAMANYSAAKKAGLKVFPTYRLGEDRESILMTSGDAKSTVCIGTEPATSLPGRGEPKIPSIESTACASLMDRVFAQAILAANHDISVHSDAFFFLYDTSTGGIDFVIGDLDNVSSRRLLPNESRLLSNLHSAGIALESFVVDNVENPGVYLKSIGEAYSETKIAQGYSNY